MQAWKMFRTASMLWETYNLKHAHGDTQRSKEEESGWPPDLPTSYLL